MRFENNKEKTYAFIETFLNHIKNTFWDSIFETIHIAEKQWECTSIELAAQNKVFVSGLALCVQRFVIHWDTTKCFIDEDFENKDRRIESFFPKLFGEEKLADIIDDDIGWLVFWDALFVFEQSLTDKNWDFAPKFLKWILSKTDENTQKENSIFREEWEVSIERFRKEMTAYIKQRLWKQKAEIIKTKIKEI